MRTSRLDYNDYMYISDIIEPDELYSLNMFDYYSKHVHVYTCRCVSYINYFEF